MYCRPHLNKLNLKRKKVPNCRIKLAPLFLSAMIPATAVPLPRFLFIVDKQFGRFLFLFLSLVFFPFIPLFDQSSPSPSCPVPLRSFSNKKQKWYRYRWVLRFYFFSLTLYVYVCCLCFLFFFCSSSSFQFPPSYGWVWLHGWCIVFFSLLLKALWHRAGKKTT